MSLFKQFETNKEIEQSGVWIEFGPNNDGTVPGFKIARAGKRNKKWLKAVERLTKPREFEIKRKLIDTESAEKIMQKAFVEGVLLDWRNVQDRNGNQIAFSTDSAMSLFDQLPELYDVLQDNAEKAEFFRQEALENEAKN